MDLADRYGENQSTFIIEEPESFDDLYKILNSNSSKARYLMRLVMWSNLENKDELLSQIYNGISLQDAYKLQIKLLMNQQLPNREFIPKKMWEIDLAIELAIELDEYYEQRNRF